MTLLRLILLVLLTGCAGPAPSGVRTLPVPLARSVALPAPSPPTNTYTLTWSQPGHPWQWLTVSESNDLKNWAVVTNLRVPCLYTSLTSGPVTVPMTCTVRSAAPQHFWRIQ